MTCKTRFFTVLFLMLFTTGSNAQPVSEKLNTIAEELFTLKDPGAALFVSEGNKIFINKGFGVANLKTGKKITANTHYRMASVSKQFTAMCILILQQQGKLNINDAAIKYLPSLPSFASGVTIKNLMTHSSGIADYESLIPEDRKVQVSDADVLQLVSKSDSLYFAPGTRFKYSNTSFCLLTQIVEKVSGLSYPEFIKQNIFIPLGMKHSTIYQQDSGIFERAYGYHKDNSQWQFADQSITSATMGDGSVYTSLNEYRKWIRHLWKISFTDSTLNPLKPHAFIKKGLDYGYGWFIAREADGSTGYFHSGESTGFHNIVYHNPQKKLIVVLFSNCDDDRVSQAFEAITNVLKIKLKDIPPGESLFNFLGKIYGD
ncbi:MAG: beta-lactamase family protein [Chitinophagaceae bacterium]|nr:beta-lactamase family protein [Chitinophagaceae bacterium]